MIWRWWCGCAVRIEFLRVPYSAPPRGEFSFGCEFWVKISSLIWWSGTCVLSPSCSNDLILIQTLKMIFLNNRSNCTGAKFNRLGASSKCCSF